MLLVEDNARLRDEARQILEQAGHKVHSATSGEEGIRMYQKLHKSIDVAVVDVIMPDTDGQQVLRQILRVNPSAGVIMTCGFSRDFARSYLAPGTWKFVQKPFDPEQLLNTVRRVLDEKTP